MKIVAWLPRDRLAYGSLFAYSRDGVELYGPVRCRGEADDAAARRAGNPGEAPERPFGDHPFGAYRVVAVEMGKVPASSYGPAFLRLDPVDDVSGGEARAGELAGRAGLGIHGGDLGPGQTLRATFGCLRVSNEDVIVLASLAASALRRGDVVDYECREQKEA